jgi:hypothetical protein
MLVMAVAVDWMIVTLVMSLVGLWVIAQLRIWRARGQPPSCPERSGFYGYPNQLAGPSSSKASMIAHVCGPTTPSMMTWNRCCRSLTADSVLAP